MPEPALLMLATRQMNTLLRANYTLEQVAEMDPIWHTLAYTLRTRMAPGIPSGAEATE